MGKSFFLLVKLCRHQAPQPLLITMIYCHPNNGYRIVLNVKLSTAILYILYLTTTYIQNQMYELIQDLLLHFFEVWDKVMVFKWCEAVSSVFSWGLLHVQHGNQRGSVCIPLLYYYPNSNILWRLLLHQRLLTLYAPLICGS